MPLSPFASFSALIRAGRESGPQRTVGAATKRRLLIYYTAVAAMVAVVELSIPLAPSGEGRILVPGLERLLFATATGTRIVPAWLDAILAMATAFVLTVPTVIVYVRTRSSKEFDETLVNTVLVLPSVIAAILIVVQSSLALAFSLTGIVAAVRFRSNVKESRDALYIFASVAIGFASGVYALDVAAAVSLCFVLLELFAWRSGLGGDRSRKQQGLWGEVPMISARAVAVAGELLRPPRNGKGADPKARANGHAERPRDLVLRVGARDPEDARLVVEAVLAATTKKWRFRGMVYHEGRAVGLEYRARLRRTQTPEEVRDRLLHDGVPFVTAAEWAA